MVNGSPDCCPELSTVYEKTCGISQEYLQWWDALDEEDERFTFGRRKFWQPLEWSKNPTYELLHNDGQGLLNRWFENTGSQIVNMLKPMNTIGEDHEFLLYAKYAAELPHKYHAMVVRVTNIDRALELVPGSKAIVTQRTTVPSAQEMYVYLCEEFALSKSVLVDPDAVEEVKKLQPNVDWPYDSGNSPNGYLPGSTVDKITQHVRRDVLYADSLQQQYHNNGIVLVGPNDFLNTQTLPNIYQQLGIEQPTKEWLDTWVQRFRTNARIDEPGNPDFELVVQKCTRLLSRWLEKG